MDQCVFCRIVAGHLPADVVMEDERVLAFRDRNPQAPTHVLVIPREHVPSLDALEDPGLAGALLLAARDVARIEGLAERGFRVVLNTGGEGGQTVDHVHAHVLGGRGMRWPPG